MWGGKTRGVLRVCSNQNIKWTMSLTVAPKHREDGGRGVGSGRVGRERGFEAAGEQLERHQVSSPEKGLSLFAGLVRGLDAIGTFALEKPCSPASSQGGTDATHRGTLFPLHRVALFELGGHKTFVRRQDRAAMSPCHHRTQTFRPCPPLPTYLAMAKPCTITITHRDTNKTSAVPTPSAPPDYSNSMERAWVAVNSARSCSSDRRSVSSTCQKFHEAPRAPQPQHEVTPALAIDYPRAQGHHVLD